MFLLKYPEIVEGLTRFDRQWTIFYSGPTKGINLIDCVQMAYLQFSPWSLSQRWFTQSNGNKPC